MWKKTSQIRGKNNIKLWYWYQQSRFKKTERDDCYGSWRERLNLSREGCEISKMSSRRVLVFFVCLGWGTFSFLWVILPVPPPPKPSCVDERPLTIAKDIIAAPNSSVESTDYTCPLSICTQFVSSVTNHFTSGLIL